MNPRMPNGKHTHSSTPTRNALKVTCKNCGQMLLGSKETCSADLLRGLAQGTCAEEKLAHRACSEKRILLEEKLVEK